MTHSKDSEAALPPMTAQRATFFLERFKREEKMLGPNEQAALAFAIAALSARAVKVQCEAATDGVRLRLALAEYPKQNPQQLQAAKVCKGVLALAARPTTDKENGNG